MKDRKHIEQNFHSVAGVMPQGWDLGVLGGSKTLAWGFAMAQHRLRIIVVGVSFTKLSEIAMFCTKVAGYSAPISRPNCWPLARVENTVVKKELNLTF